MVHCILKISDEAVNSLFKYSFKQRDSVHTEYPNHPNKVHSFALELSQSVEMIKKNPANSFNKIYAE